MKLPELIQNIKSTLYNNRVPNTHNLDDRQIIYWINEQRALFLKQEYNKVRSPLHNEIQTLFDIELEISNNTIIPIDMKSNTLLKSKKKIPRTIQWNLSDGVLGVYPTDILENNINYTDRESVIYKGNGIFNRNKIFAFKYNDYLWIKYGPKTDKSRVVRNVNLEGIFENPLEVDTFNGTKNLIRFGKEEYPVSEAFLAFIEQNIWQTHINQFVMDIQANDNEDQTTQNQNK